jgi:uncharacterized protein YndB with AHSA1/START domain
MATITKTYELSVPPRVVWDALTDPIQIEGWGAGPNVVFECQEGGAFSLWDGGIHGTILDTDDEVRIIQEWFTEGHDYPTEVTMTLEASEEGTTLQIVQTNVQDEDVEEFDRGWDEYYVGPLKEYCEQP